MVTADRRRGPFGTLLVFAVLSLLLSAGCGLLPGGAPGSRRSSETSAGPTTSTSAPATSKSAPASRPIQPVPDIRPAGFISPPPGQGLQRYLGQKIQWSDCGKGLQCAAVLAPLDYAQPDAEAITLAIAKRPASAGPAAGSLFINPGGPGGSGTEYVGYFEVKGLERFDVVGWDPRGTGSSTPVTCANGRAMDAYTSVDISPDDATEEQALIDAQVDFGRGCLKRSGALLEHISTTETVRDLDLLRHLVGDEKLTYFGSSYGTKIGALYAQLYPGRVGRMVLDGAVNITDNKDVSQLDGFERALGNFAAWCADKSCKLGDTKAEVERSISDLLNRLDAKPINGGRAPLTQQLAVTGILNVLYENEEGWKYLQQGLELAAFDSDGRYLMFFADQYNQRGRDGSYGQLQFSFPAIRCRRLPGRQRGRSRAGGGRGGQTGSHARPVLRCRSGLPAVAGRPSPQGAEDRGPRRRADPGGGDDRRSGDPVRVRGADGRPARVGAPADSEGGGAPRLRPEPLHPALRPGLPARRARARGRHPLLTAELLRICWEHWRASRIRWGEPRARGACRPGPQFEVEHLGRREDESGCATRSGWPESAP